MSKLKEELYCSTVLRPLVVLKMTTILAIGVVPFSGARAQVLPAESAVVLSELSVIGSGERANGPVTGYRASRSATSTRTDTALRDSPQSVQVVPRDVLLDQQDVRLTDALTNVSNVQPAGTIQGRSDAYVLRGFNTQTYAIDGVLLNPANTFQPTQRDLANVERVEVLKGPTSVLYGRGDPGGLINIVTRQPMLTPSADLTLQGGSYAFRRLQGSVTGAVPGTEGLAARFSFATQDDPTFRDFGGPSNSRHFFAPSLLWTPDASTRISLSAEFSRQHSQYDEGLTAFQGRVPLDNIRRYYGESWSRYYGESNSITLRAEHDVNESLTLRQVINGQWGQFDVLATRATGVSANVASLTRRLSEVESIYNSIDSQTGSRCPFRPVRLPPHGPVRRRNRRRLSSSLYAAGDSKRGFLPQPDPGIDPADRNARPAE